jgi:hypothetical protein
MNARQLFLQHVGQTSEAPLCLNIVKASGSKMWDADGKEFIDLIAGISVCNIGHCHPKVVDAIKKQAEAYLHIMVYGEFVENPQVDYATKLTSYLPENLIPQLTENSIILDFRADEIIKNDLLSNKILYFSFQNILNKIQATKENEEILCEICFSEIVKTCLCKRFDATKEQN